nr:hypothetical protein [Halomonas azerica]
MLGRVGNCKICLTCQSFNRGWRLSQVLQQGQAMTIPQCPGDLCQGIQHILLRRHNGFPH